MHRNIENKIGICVVEQKREKEAIPTNLVCDIWSLIVRSTIIGKCVVWCGVV
jgi:hypothetical protein